MLISIWLNPGRSDAADHIRALEEINGIYSKGFFRLETPDVCISAGHPAFVRIYFISYQMSFRLLETISSA